MAPTEMLGLGRRIEEFEKVEAKKRLVEAGRLGGKGSGKLPEASAGQVRDKVADALGISGRTYEKARQVMDAEKEPERLGVH